LNKKLQKYISIINIYGKMGTALHLIGVEVVSNIFMNFQLENNLQIFAILRQLVKILTLKADFFGKITI